MFSRSEKTDEVLDVMAEPSGERSPMVLAALAGLLAVAGAFLLVWYLNSGSDDVATDGGSSAVSGSEGGGDGDSASSSAGVSAEASQQVLVVTKAIPRGTSVRELIEAPTVYLSARAVPEQFVAASAITSVAELNELDGKVLASEALPGEQLLRGRFRDPGDFDSNSETFLEDAIELEIPPLHHAVVVELPASRALGGLLRKGELVTVVTNLRVSPEGASPREVSVVVLNSVEVLNVDSSLEVAGQVASDFNAVGVASRGSYTITLAVTPEELTDLTYAISYGEIMLATAIPGVENEGSAKAVTTERQLMGDDGLWLQELDDGNVVGLIELFPPESEEATSIEVVLPQPGDSDEEPTERELELGELDDAEGDPTTVGDDEPGDS